MRDNYLKNKKMKKRHIILLGIFLAPLWMMAQYNGGNGRGDFSVRYMDCLNPSTGGAVTKGAPICSGSVPQALNDSVTPSGHTGILQYQWQMSVTGSGSGFSDIGGATSAGYSPGALTVTTWFKRKAKVTCLSDWVESNVVVIGVSPLTVGGNAAGPDSVCYGANNPILTLSGHTGSVVKWQESSGNIVWTDIPGSTSATYSPLNLTQETWYRAVVKSGTCSSENSSPKKISINSDYHISGYARYENNPQTPLNGLKITLRKNGNIIGSTNTTNAGYYDFGGLVNGNYSLEISSAHPGGQWQTWGGVTNTDALMVSNHINNTTLLPVNPPVVRIAADVKSSIPAAINNTDYLAIRQAAKSGWGFFDIPKWVFSGTTVAEDLAGIDLSCSNITRNIRGLCAGDVNGTYSPVTGFKTLESGIELVTRGSTPMTGHDVVFPIFAESSEELHLSAITLALDYDPAILSITGVAMPDPGEEEPWFETSNGKLRIDWLSADPIVVDPVRPLMLIRAKVKDPSGLAELNNPICFSLSENLASEMADRMGTVYSGIRLIVPAGNSGSAGFNSAGSENLTVYPNPVRERLNLEFPMESDGSFSAEVQTMEGTTVIATGSRELQAGWQKEAIDMTSLTNGVYLLKLSVGDRVIVRKIVVNR